MLMLVHGWGFDRSIWGEVLRALGDPPATAIDLGYFNAGATAMPDGPIVAVGHSFGALWLLRNRPTALRALIAINGFDHFPAPRRVLDRMLERFETAPREVLGEFRRRCGGDAPPEAIDADRLRADLTLLRDADERGTAASLGRSILSLQGGDDPILPIAARDAAFAGAMERATLPGHGHLLPLTAPAWCAERIGAFL